MSDAPQNVPMARTAARKRWGLLLFLPLATSMIEKPPVVFSRALASVGRST